MSSCSEYFRNILVKHVHSHPLICLDGVSSEDIKNVLDFIYTGELQIFQEDLDKFLYIAEKLKLDGLVGIQDLACKSMKDETPKFEEDILDKNVISEKIKVEPNIEGNEGVIAISFSSAEFPNIEELDSKIIKNSQKIKNIGTQCFICGRIFKKADHAKEHVEVSHIEGLKFPCNICNKVLKNRRAIRSHKSSCKSK